MSDIGSPMKGLEGSSADQDSSMGGLESPSRGSVSVASTKGPDSPTRDPVTPTRSPATPPAQVEDTTMSGLDTPPANLDKLPRLPNGFDPTPPRAVRTSIEDPGTPPPPKKPSTVVSSDSQGSPIIRSRARHDSREDHLWETTPTRPAREARNMDVAVDGQSLSIGGTPQTGETPPLAKTPPLEQRPESGRDSPIAVEKVFKKSNALPSEKPKILLVMNFDQTITENDTKGQFCSLAVEVETVSQQVLKGVDNHYRKAMTKAQKIWAHLRGTTVASELDYLDHVGIKELQLIDAIDESGLFREFTEKKVREWAVSALNEEEVKLRPGLRELMRVMDQANMLPYDPRNKVYLAIISANWSAAFVRQTMTKNLKDIYKGALFTNEIDFGGDRRYNSPLGKWDNPPGKRGIWTPKDKAEVFTNILENGWLANHGDPNCQSWKTKSGEIKIPKVDIEKTKIVYVGDGPSDLEPLLMADIGILMQNDPLQKCQYDFLLTLRRIGFIVLPLAQYDASWEADVYRQGMFLWTAENFYEVAQCPMFELRPRCAEDPDDKARREKTAALRAVLYDPALAWSGPPGASPTHKTTSTPPDSSVPESDPAEEDRFDNPENRAIWDNVVDNFVCSASPPSQALLRSIINCDDDFPMPTLPSASSSGEPCSSPAQAQSAHASPKRKTASAPKEDNDDPETTAKHEAIRDGFMKWQEVQTPGSFSKDP